MANISYTCFYVNSGTDFSKCVVANKIYFKVTDQPVKLTKSIKSVSPKILPQWWIFVAETLGHNKEHISVWF